MFVLQSYPSFEAHPADPYICSSVTLTDGRNDPKQQWRTKKSWGHLADSWFWSFVMAED
jgi:hypothetical protein